MVLHFSAVQILKSILLPLIIWIVHLICQVVLPLLKSLQMSTGRTIQSCTTFPFTTPRLWPKSAWQSTRPTWTPWTIRSGSRSTSTTPLFSSTSATSRWCLWGEGVGTGQPAALPAEASCSMACITVLGLTVVGPALLQPASRCWDSLWSGLLLL